MIVCGKISSIQLLKIFGIAQCVIAAIITGIGITITVKFRSAKHEEDAGIALDYIDNQWITEYGGGIWMGLLLLVAGIFGSLSDAKREKAKYAYACLASNILVIIFAIILLPFASEAISWFDTCKYKYHKASTGAIGIKACPQDEKDLGTNLYTTLVVALVLVIPVSIVTLGLVIIANAVLFEGCLSGTCYRELIYKMKNSNNSQVKVKTKNTHEFDQVYMETSPQVIHGDANENSEQHSYNMNGSSVNDSYSNSVYI